MTRETALRDDVHTWITTRAGTALYDVRTDPWEQDDRAAADPALTADGRARIEAFRTALQAEGTRLKLHDDTTAMRYLRVFALSRLYLDNFPSLQVSWPTMGPEVGQVALRFGGNDFGSAMIEENVVSQAGAVFKLGADDIERYIRGAGFQPQRRNMRYERLRS